MGPDLAFVGVGDAVRIITAADILLADYGATVSNIHSNLRELSIDIQEEKQRIVLHALYASLPNPECDDLIECITSEMCAALFPPYNVIAEMQYSNAVNRLPLPGRTLFSRYEEG